MSKYDPLWQSFASRKEELLVLSFEQIKNILGFPIDHSFLNYKKELMEYGYAVKKISLKEKTVVFERVGV